MIPVFSYCEPTTPQGFPASMTVNAGKGYIRIAFAGRHSETRSEIVLSKAQALQLAEAIQAAL